ncbi:MAG: S1 family peptidase, partial [Polyangia bacterium]
GEQIVGVTVSGDADCQSYALQARVDVAVADFIQPYLDATAAAPAGRPAGTIDVAALCQTACSSAADCPAALACEPATPDRPATCSVSQSPPASFGAVCAHDAECGSGQTCARLWPDGADACRCSQPCPGGPPTGPGGGSHGCSIGAHAPAPSWVWLLLVAVGGGRALRRARRCARSSA